MHHRTALIIFSSSLRTSVDAPTQHWTVQKYFIRTGLMKACDWGSDFTRLPRETSFLWNPF